MQMSELGQVPVMADDKQGYTRQLGCKCTCIHKDVPGHKTSCTGHANVQACSRFLAGTASHAESCLWRVESAVNRGFTTCVTWQVST